MSNTKTLILTAIVDGDVQAWIRDATVNTENHLTLSNLNLPIKTKGAPWPVTMNSDGLHLMYLGEYSSDNSTEETQPQKLHS